MAESKQIEKMKSMLIGSDRKLHAATAISVSVFGKEVEGIGHLKCLGVLTLYLNGAY